MKKGAEAVAGVRPVEGKNGKLESDLRANLDDARVAAQNLVPLIK